MRPTRTTTALSIFLLGAFTVIADIPPCGWSQPFGGTVGGIDYVNFIFSTEDSSGNVISVGGFKGTISFGGQTNLSSVNNSANDIFIVKFNSSGTLQWGQALGSSGADQAYGAATDSSGNIFVAGVYHGPVNFGVSNATATVGVFLAKYNPSGICQWVNTILNKTLSTTGQPVAVDSAGNPFIVAFDSVYKYASTTGAQLWTTNVGGFGQAIAIDGNGDAFVSGYFSGTATIGTNSFTSAGADDCFVAKVYGANGYSGWSKAGGGSGEDTFRGIAVDQNSNVVAVGQFTGTATFSGSNIVSQFAAGIVVAKYNGSSGSLMFLRGLGPITYTGSSAANSVCVDKNNNILVTGVATGGVDFGGGNFLGDGSGNVFVANFDDTTCNTAYAYQYGGQGADTGTTIFAIKSGEIIVSGTFPQSITFDPPGGPVVCGTMNNPFWGIQNGEYYGFLVKFQVKTYFVDPVSGNDANPGTAMNLAWQHIPGSLQGGTNYLTGSGWVEIDDGNTIVVKGGTTNYCQVQFATPGTSGMKGYNGAAHYDSILVQSGHLFSPQWGTTNAIFDEGFTNVFGMAIGQGCCPGNPGINGITLDGFEIRNIKSGTPPSPWSSGTQGGSACILIGSGPNNTDSYCTIKRCWLHDAQRFPPELANPTGNDCGHGIEFDRADHFIITENTIGPNIGTKGCETLGSVFGVVSNNFFCGTGDHSLALTSSTNVDATANMIYYLPPQVHEPSYGIQIAACKFCDVWNNVVYRPVPIVHSNFNIIVGTTTNTLGYDYSMGIGCYQGGLSNRVINNTVAYFGDRLNGSISSAIRIHDNAPYNDFGLIFQNNVVYNCWNTEDSNQTESYFVSTNYAVGEQVKFNNFFSPTNSTQMGYIAGANKLAFTVANFPLNTFTGHTYTNNQQLDPVFTGGGLPTGLDATYRPNSNYFLPLQGSVPFAVASTKNAINGDSVHGYSSATNKFATDIAGVGRSQWTMGAYEVGVSTPGIYGTWTKAVTNWTSTSIPVTVPAGNSIVFVGGYCLQALSSGNPGWTIGGGIVGATNYFRSTGSTNFGLLQLTSAPFTTTTNIPNASVQINGAGQVSDHNTAAFIVCIMTNTPYPITPLVDGVAMTYLQFPATAASDTATPASQPGDLMFDIIVTPMNPFTNAPGQTFVASVPNGTATLRASWSVATSTSTPMTWTGTADTLSHIAVAISQRKSTAYVTNLRMQQ